MKKTIRNRWLHIKTFDRFWPEVWIQIQDSGWIRRQSLVAGIAVPVHSPGRGAPVPAVVRVPATVTARVLSRKETHWQKTSEVMWSVWLSPSAASFIPILFDSAFMGFLILLLLQPRSKAYPWRQLSSWSQNKKHTNSNTTPKRVVLVYPSAFKHF